LRLLWIATKSPSPPVDGGRLLLCETLAALAAAGAKITLVAPVAARERAAASEALSAWCRPELVEAAPRSKAAAALRSLATGRAWSVVRHDSRALRGAVAREIARRRPDLVVAEQLQAFAPGAPAARAGIPRLLRAQNVESDLWRQLAARMRGGGRALVAREARRLARAERKALVEAAATVALSSEDALAFAALAGGDAPRIEVLPPPFPGELPSGTARLDGGPALALFGSAGWEPNRRAERRFLAETWPKLRRELPAARLHRFGEPGDAKGADGVVAHRSPAESRDAFDPRALLVLPLDLASGVRMRILEAWARGTPVAASAAAASGLRFRPGEELLLATSEEEWTREIRDYATTPGLAAQLVAAGRARLALDHDPARFAARFLELTREVSRAGRRG
jgi:hypothetical protein